MNRLAGKVVLLTGAPGGVGWQMARTLAAQGAALALNHETDDEQKIKALQLADELAGRHNATHRCYGADITNENMVTGMVQKIIRDYGRLDVLVNNAGITYNAMSWKLPADAWEKVLAVNLSGAFYCAKAVLPIMRQREYGRIISISSVVGLRGALGTVAYAASKAGLIGMTKTMAREVADKNITVNCVLPGYLNAGIIRDVPEKIQQESTIPSIPMGRLGQTQDIANAVVFLASDEAGYITGESLRVDGGFAI